VKVKQFRKGKDKMKERLGFGCAFGVRLLKVEEASDICKARNETNQDRVGEGLQKGTEGGRIAFNECDSSLSVELKTGSGKVVAKLKQSRGQVSPPILESLFSLSNKFWGVWRSAIKMKNTHDLKPFHSKTEPYIKNVCESERERDRQHMLVHFVGKIGLEGRN
jgi:hypothetical protein